MKTADPLTTTGIAACVAVLIVHAGIGKRMLAWRVAAERRRRRPRRRPSERGRR
jgi:hypothetical protein